MSAHRRRTPRRSSTINLTTLPRGIARLEYTALRLPLSLLHRGVFTHLPDEAAVRLSFERALGALDGVVGRLLADQTIIRRGQALAHRSEFLETAAKLEAAAEARRAAAEENLHTAQAQARHTREQAQRRGQDDITAARNREQKEKEQTRAQAETQAQAVKEQADRQADQRIAEAEHTKQAREQRITAQAAQATAAPKRQLADAASKHDAADDRREEADRLAQLADTERNQRRTAHRSDNGNRAAAR